MIAVVVVFALILLNGIIAGRGGILTPVGTETPIASESPAVSPSAAPPGEPGGQPVGPRFRGPVRECAAVRRPICAGERFSRTLLIARRRAERRSHGC